MNELLSDPRLSVALFGFLMSIFGFISKRLHDKVEVHEKEHVTREELRETVTQMRDDRERMHQENRGDLQYIRERIDSMSDARR